MIVAADLHTHFYPMFSAEAVLRSALSNLHQFVADGATVDETLIAVFDRDGQEQYRDLLKQSKAFAQVSEPTERIARIEADFGKLWIVAGHQLVSSERLEVLALGSRHHELTHRLPVKELIQKIREKNGMPVINWAPGKWSGKRGRIVAELLRDRTLFVGDTALRAVSEPSAMSDGDRSVVAGSDPFPWTSEISRIGQYGMIIGCDVSPPVFAHDPLTHLRSALSRSKHEAQAPVRSGARLGLVGMTRRVLQNELVRRGIL